MEEKSSTRLARHILSFLSSKKTGRPEGNLFEPNPLTLKRAYEVQWKKSTPDPHELAKLYRDQGLTQRQIAELYKIRRSTVAMAIRRCVNERGSNL